MTRAFVIKKFHTNCLFLFIFFLSLAATNTNQAHPLIRLSPPRSKYTYTLRRTEGICDLFHPMGGSINR